MKKQRKPINSDWVILACIAIIVIIINVCTSCRSTLTEAGPGECISISIFGKLELKNIDRVVITLYEKEYIVADADLIDRFVSETRTATRADSECHAECCGCDYPHMLVQLYHKDKLIRSMQWQGCCNYVKVYEPDLTHWLLPPIGGKAEAGYVVLSNELIEQLNTLISVN